MRRIGQYKNERHPMKKLILLCTVLAGALSLFACSPAPKPGSIQVSCDEFYELPHIRREVSVAVGDTFTVTLCSNPSTGFQWEAAKISDPGVLEEVDHKFILPGSEPPPPPGTPGQEVWTFKALKAGESTVSIDYSRPWEGGEKGAWTFVLSVSVQ
jgi:inhibitor of cysteine peptidase